MAPPTNCQNPDSVMALNYGNIDVNSANFHLHAYHFRHPLMEAHSILKVANDSMAGKGPDDRWIVDSMILYRNQRMKSAAVDDSSASKSPINAQPIDRRRIKDTFELHRDRLSVDANVSYRKVDHRDVTSTSADFTTKTPWQDVTARVDQVAKSTLEMNTSAARARRRQRQRDHTRRSSKPATCHPSTDTGLSPATPVEAVRHVDESNTNPLEGCDSSENKSSESARSKQIKEHPRRIHSERSSSDVKGQSICDLEYPTEAQQVPSSFTYSGPLFIGRYQWQTRRRGCRSWDDVDRSVNEELELSFCDVRKDCHTTTDPITGIGVEYFFEDNTFREKTRHGTLTGQLCRLKMNVGDDVGTLTNIGFIQDTMWQWYWESGNDAWQAFDARKLPTTPGELTTSLTRVSIMDRYLTSDELESRYSTHRSENVGFRCSIRRHGRADLDYRFDFERMIQVNMATEVERRIRRRPAWFRSSEMYAHKVLQSILDLSDITARYPPVWSSSPASVCGSRYQLIPIFDHGTTVDEYNMVALLFSRTMFPIIPRTIWRVQNRDRWNEFMQFKRTLEKRIGSEVNQRRLFHGTNESSVRPICDRGFDFRLFGMSTGAIYGNGSYFASSAKYSDDYTDCRKMFVVQVLVGHYAKGGPNMSRPPSKDPLRPHDELYDSCVDDINKPTIFVTFDCHQSYPEYLIEY